MERKYSFIDDYSEGAHPRILEALTRTNLMQEMGYGYDQFSRQAVELIKGKIGNPNAKVFLVTGGTQANLIVLASILKPYESVIATNNAHIGVFEAGAVEATGHKINVVPTKDGKIKPEQIIMVCEEHIDEHMVKPKAVFITNSTELGTVYKKRELEDIAATCKQKGLLLYLDGARIGSALESLESDLTLPELSNLVDAFYIGATKNGALLGEAIIINNPYIQTEFIYHVKQRGALLAKGRIIGIQFIELFRDNLYFELARYANEMASRLRTGIRDQGYGFFSDSTTNQVFPIFPNTVLKKLQDVYGYSIWTKVDADHTAIRLVASWATPENAVNGFLDELKKATNTNTNK